MGAIPFLRESAADHTSELVAAFLGLAQETAGRLTDFNIGSNTLTLLEAVATRLENLDAKAWLALARAIPTAVFDSFGFAALPALPAMAPVTFFRAAGATGDLSAPINTRVQQAAAGSVPARDYLTTVPLTIPDGVPSGVVTVQATKVGTIGRAPAQALVLVDELPGVASATNLAAILGGRDPETDEARRLRFVDFIRNLARSQDAGLEVGALTAALAVGGVVTEQVLFARAVPVQYKRGLTRLYVDNGGGTASPALVAAAQTIIDGSRATDGTRIPGYKASGIDVVVTAVTSQVVPVTVRVVLAPGYGLLDLQFPVNAAIEGYVDALGVFGDLIVADLIAAVVAIRGVRDVTIVTPTANVLAQTGKRIIPGVITVQA